jgi:Tfp pilus assembly protein PilF
MTKPKPAMTPRRALWLGLLAALPFVASVRNGYLMDDRVAVAENPVATARLPLAQAVTRDFWGRDAAHTIGSYRPLGSLAIALETRGLGLHPWLSHAMNVLLHSTIVVGLFLLLGRLGASTRISALAAALFATLAAPSEAVLTIVGRADMLSLLLGMAATWLHLRSRANAAAAVFLLALLTKETAVGFILVWAVIDFVQTKGWTRWIQTYALYGGALAFAFALRYLVLGSFSGWDTEPLVNPAFHLGLAQQILGGLKAYGLAVMLLIRPTPLSYDYSYNAFGFPLGPGDPIAVIGAIALVGGLALSYRLRRRSPLAAGGLAWFVLLFLPVSNLLVPLPTVFAERLLYAPALGLCVVGAVGLDALWPRVGPRWAGALVGVLVATQSAASLMRTVAWHSPMHLYLSADEGASGSFRVQYNLGCAYFDRGDSVRSEKYARRAIETAPMWAAPRGLLGAIYAVDGQMDLAAREFAIGQRLANDAGGDHMLRHSYAVFLWKKGEKEEARRLLRTALREDPSDVRAKRLLATLMQK